MSTAVVRLLQLLAQSVTCQMCRKFEKNIICILITGISCVGALERSVTLTAVLITCLDLHKPSLYLKNIF